MTTRRNVSTFTRRLLFLAVPAVIAACARSEDGDGSAAPPPDERFTPQPEPPIPPPPPPPPSNGDGGDPFGVPVEDAGYEPCSPDAWCEVTVGDEPLPGLRSIWGFAANDVWFAGADGFTLHYDGSTFTRVATGTKYALTSLWGAAPNDLWAVGVNSTILHWDGSIWSRSSKKFGVTLNRIWGRDSENVWAVGIPSTIFRGNGTLDGWSEVKLSSTASFNFASAFGNAQEVWATYGEQTYYPGIARFGVDDPEPVPIRSTSSTKVYPEAIWSSRPGEAWIAGWSNDTLHQTKTGIPAYIGTIIEVGKNASGTPVLKNTFTGGSHAQLRAIWGIPSEPAGSEEMWAVGEQANVIHRKDGKWSLMRTARSGSIANCSLRAVWASSPSDVWAAGSCEGGRGVILRRKVQ